MSVVPPLSRSPGARLWLRWTLGAVLLGVLAMHGLAQGSASASATAAPHTGGGHHQTTGQSGEVRTSHDPRAEPVAAQARLASPGGSESPGSAGHAESAAHAELSEYAGSSGHSESSGRVPSSGVIPSSGAAEPRVTAPCQHMDGTGNSGHLSHADATCAAPGVSSPHTPSPPLVAVDLPADGPVPGAGLPEGSRDSGSPPSLSQLQILRV